MFIESTDVDFDNIPVHNHDLRSKMGQVIQGSFQWNILVIVGRDSEVGIAPATAWTVQGLDPDGGEIFRTRPDWP
jgi:hypothetical protein